MRKMIDKKLEKYCFIFEEWKETNWIIDQQVD